MEVVGNDKKKLLWEVVGDNVVEEPSDHEAPFSYRAPQLPPNTYPSLDFPSS